MDVLSNVLGVTQLGNTVLCQSELIPPWGLEIEAGEKTSVHLVRRGLCWLRFDDGSPPRRLGAGDVILVARHTRHWITSEPHGAAEPWADALVHMKERLESRGSADPGDSTILLCAAYKFEQDGEHPLLSVLPKVIQLHVDESDENGQFPSLVRLLLHECRRNLGGSEIVVPRLVDSLFVFILRAWLDSQPAGAAGWFGALRDPQVGRALVLIHENPERPWTVAQLAKSVALSRAAFARRFGELVGEPPLKYLTRWRMSLAARILKTTSDPLDEIATRVGYESSTAFGKAFHRHLRVSPGQYRLAGRQASEHAFSARR
ncbi:MAG: cupin domain-containing protein [Myxococcota bacterium]